MRILITGVSGFVGSYLAKYLIEKGEHVAGIARTQDRTWNHPKALTLFKADLNNFKATQSIVRTFKPDTIVHLAAFSSVFESFKNPLKTLENNIHGQLSLLEVVRSLKIKPLILLISSADIYGRVAEKDIPINEKVDVQPLSPYGVSKAVQDFLGKMYFQIYKLPIIRLRPFPHIGPGQSDAFVGSAFAKKIVQAERSKASHPYIHVGNLKAIRDFTDVRDMVRAYYLAIKKGKIGDVYNIGSGKGITIANLLNTMLAMSPKKILVRRDEKLYRPLEIPILISDSTKFVKTTGWKPLIPLERTLRDSISYVRNTL